ncbi:hypothetical protein Vadar_031112 [Vaccinium darrowii]|uniref:Uncharacterized protein n=1 Tax=Vaccinium darrowii TaxID=229202 RepID=A0ACB7ZFM4_9ERIC|nr:hypothetical protein Vadar_031112 [Vaccinium darrowii]
MCRRQGKNDVEMRNNVDMEFSNNTGYNYNVDMEWYPMMLEGPQMRWAFTRKVYPILAFQLLLTAAVAFVVVLVRPFSVFFATTTAGLVLHFVLLLIPVIVLWPLYYYRKKHPLNFFLLALFTITLSFGVGLSCASTEGCIVLGAAILTTVVVVCLTLYTFWAARRGQDFNFLSSFLRASPYLILVFSTIQIFFFFPLPALWVVILYGGFQTIVFCGLIIYITDYVIKCHFYTTDTFGLLCHCISLHIIPFLVMQIFFSVCCNLEVKNAIQ